MSTVSGHNYASGFRRGSLKPKPSSQSLVEMFVVEDRHTFAKGYRLVTGLRVQ
jgi:hypothetical protein